MAGLRKFRIWMRASRQRFALTHAVLIVPIMLVFEAVLRPEQITLAYFLFLVIRGLMTGYAIGFLAWSLRSVKSPS